MPVFSFSLFSEPHSLDPQKSTMSGGAYLFTNIFRGLLRVDAGDKLKPEIAESCHRQRKNRTIVCLLRTDALWSNGTPIKAMDFVRAFRALIDPNNAYPEAELLIAVKNARDIHKGEKPPGSLGVRAIGERKIEVELSQDDEDFEWKLAHPALSPRPEKIPPREEASNLVVNGPYKITDWKVGSRILLSNNPFYKRGSQKRPNLEVLFLQDDALALRMFDGGRLSFNRRILQESIKNYEKHPGFVRVPLARFDYIGFGPAFKDQPFLRQAMLRGADYPTFAPLFDSKTTAGCPAMDKDFFSPYSCVQFDLNRAKELLGKVPEEARKKTYRFGFSQLGGFHIEKGVQWFQNQWKKNLGLHIELKSEEQGVYLRQLKTNPPDLFRKGVGLDRLTCLAGLELFESKNPENYIRFESKEYDQIISALNRKQNSKKRQQLCSKAFKLLVDQAVILPLGEMYFNVLGDEKFKGWTVNSLNILDLTDLRFEN